MERPNLGKSRVLVECDNLMYTEAALTPRISYSRVTSAVTIPRQLAPTVGHRAKGVYIMGEALRGMKRLAIGKIIINSSGERVIDDTDWNLGLDQVQEGNIIPFGKINVFCRHGAHYEIRPGGLHARRRVRSCTIR